MFIKKLEGIMKLYLSSEGLGNKQYILEKCLPKYLEEDLEK